MPNAILIRQDKVARGNPRCGTQFFQPVCAGCHGFDGTDINFHSAKDTEYVGTVRSYNPWESLRNISFDQPGVGMVALTIIEVKHRVDILSYCQTLPTKQPSVI